MRKTSLLSARGREFQRLAHQFDCLFRQSEERPSIGDCTPSPHVLLQIIRARRARAECFPAHLFSEPAWDMLLDLLHADILDHNVSVSSVCIASNAPATTALRYLHLLEQDALVKRIPDPCDHRRCFIRLTEDAEAAFAELFANHPIQPIF